MFPNEDRIRTARMKARAHWHRSLEDGKTSEVGRFEDALRVFESTLVEEELKRIRSTWLGRLFLRD